MNKKFLSLLILSLSLISSTVNADTIIKFDLGANNDVEFVGGIFRTVNDGIASTPGNQNSDIDFSGFLDASFSDILSGASVTISNIVASAEVNVFGTVISQATNGGSINLWSNTGSLLLSAVVGEGNIAGSIDGVTGSFFNTNSMTYTGGSLLSHVQATPAGISLGLSGIQSGLFPGMTVSFNASSGAFELDSFRADASGLLTGSPIPEPASMLLLSSAILGGIVSRRKKAI